jgi:Type II secretion system (T2SS), protein E, N-terminal domain
MTKRPIRIGELLVEMGRVTGEDIERALAHQRQHGGYMGDALVTLGILTHEELWWGLADQHGIPFVHLRAEHIDHRLAARVPAEWARDHQVLPVLWDEGRVTVVMREVAAPGVLEEVRRLTGATEVVSALSSPDAIAELIEAVHGPARGVGVAALVAEALERGATAFGVSVRPGRVVGWFRAGGVVSRPLGPEWRAELGRVVEPALGGAAPGAPARWSALLRLGDEVRLLDCHAAGGGEALEWAAVVGDPLPADPARTFVDPALLARVRGARLAARVECEPGAGRAAEALLALLPGLMLGDAARAIHLSDRDGSAPPGVLALRVTEPVEAMARGLEPFFPDAVTLCAESPGAGDLAALRRLAPFVAILPRSGDGEDAPFDCVIRLRMAGAEAAWTLAEGD